MKKTLFLASLLVPAVCCTSVAQAEGTYEIAAGQTVTYAAASFADYDAINVAGTLNTNAQAISQAITLQTGSTLTSSSNSWGDGQLLSGRVLLEGNADIAGNGTNFGGEVNLNGNTMTVKAGGSPGVYFREGSSLTGSGTIDVQSRMLQFRDSSISNSDVTLNISGGSVEVRSANTTTLAGVTGTNGNAILKTGDIAASTLELAGDGTYTFAGKVKNDNANRVLTINHTGTGTQTFSGTIEGGIINGQAANKELTIISGTISGGTIANAKVTGTISGGTVNDSVISGTVSGGTVNTSTLSHGLAGGTVNNSTVSGQITGGTINGGTYTSNDVRGGTLTGGVVLAANERLNVKGSSHVTLGDVVHNASAGLNGFAVVIYETSELTINGTADFTSKDWNMIGIENNSSVIVDNGGVVTSGIVGWSTNSMNGALTVNEGGNLTVKGSAYVQSFTNAGTTSIQTALNASTITNSGDLTVENLGAMNNGANVTLTGGTLTVTGTAKISSLTVDGGTLNAATITYSDITSLTVNTELSFNTDAMTLTSLTLGEGAEFTLGTAESHANALTTSSMTVNGDATLNADLVTSANSTLTFNSGTVTLGCSVTFGEGSTVALGTAYLDDLAANGRVLLFTDVESYSDNLESIVVTGDFVSGHLYAEAYTAEGGATKFNIYATPEPATATLSLLALAGLMARRKRH